MKRTLISIALFAATCQPAFAASQSAQPSEAQLNETIGTGSGLVAGAIVGGPVGAIIGATIGALIADDINDEARVSRQNNEIASMRSALHSTRQEQVALQQAVENYRQQARYLSEAKQRAQQNVAALEASIQFRTASDKLEVHYQPQLLQLADTLKSAPELQVNLVGYADKRGADTYNHTLSVQRVERIKGFLLAQGVNETQIAVQARGEKDALSSDGGWESDFFDRRVVMSLQMSADGMMASNEEQ